MATPLTKEVAAAFAPVRPAGGHKGTFGHALIVAGSPGFTGAGCLAALAAGRAGAGLVTVACPASLNTIFEIKLTEPMTLPVADTASACFGSMSVDQVVRAARTRTAVGIGPGLGQAQDTVEFVHDVLAQVHCPIVVDADALNAITDNPSGRLARVEHGIVTPHPGEMARLTKLATADIQTDRHRVAARFAEEWNVVVVLKGSGTVIAAPDGNVWENTTGNHGLASGGTGDVLTGLLTGLLAQGCEPAAAACLGVFLHGLAADILAKRTSPRGMLAGDLLPVLGEAWQLVCSDEGSPPV